MQNYQTNDCEYKKLYICFMGVRYFTLTIVKEHAFYKHFYTPALAFIKHIQNKKANPERLAHLHTASSNG